MTPPPRNAPIFVSTRRYRVSGPCGRQGHACPHASLSHIQAHIRTRGQDLESLAHTDLNVTEAFVGGACVKWRQEVRKALESSSCSTLCTCLLRQTSAARRDRAERSRGEGSRHTILVGSHAEVVVSRVCSSPPRTKQRENTMSTHSTHSSTRASTQALLPPHASTHAPATYTHTPHSTHPGTGQRGEPGRRPSLPARRIPARPERCTQGSHDCC